ncbi:MAG TPA: MMPL family transporter [Gaiellaceae bacterium]|nr:MMPL family transporter [Gaiellaceae bacterium]
MTTLARAVAGRRSKYVFLAAWIAALVGLGPLIGRFESVQKNEPSSFLPGGAESVAVLDAAGDFPSGEAVEAIVVFERNGGLTGADRQAIGRVRSELSASPPEGVQAVPPVRVAADGEAALIVVPIQAEGDEEVLIAAVDDLRAAAEELPGGLQAKVTGPAGYSADATKVFEGINSTLLLVTALLVFVLLVLIYRSPVFWALPLLAVFFAEGLVRGVGYLMAEAGVVINGQTGGILLVLVFGAGTDYALLLTARYREELRRHADKHEAMRIALRTAGPTIVASAGTVVAALLVLTLAQVNSIAGLGPVGAMGVAIAALAMLTVLPVLLLIGGRRAFWPFVPKLGEEDRAARGAWWRLGGWVAGRHRMVWVVTALGLAVMALGTIAYDGSLTSSQAFRGDVESVEGQRLLERSFPAGASAPTVVLVRDPDLAGEVRAAAEQAPESASVGPIETGPPGGQFTVTLTRDPFSTEAFTQVSSLRDRLREIAGDEVLVGGATAEETDLRAATSRDTKLLVPLVLAVVLLILVLLLRALAAPLVLMATVLLSYFAALGFSVLVFDWVFGFAGEDPSYALFAFIFLVALGVDYNIFLMARVREEALGTSTREAMRRGLAVTGGVITSAGVVLAGTFAVLGVLPLVALTQVGFTVAFGVLLDTLVVRSILVPALTWELGERTWWPSRLWRERSGSAVAPAATAGANHPAG